MNRPKILHVGGTLYWVIRTVNPDTQVLKDADSTPTVAVRKNGASTADTVTVTKRSATTGIYDCSYNPAGEVEGDEFTIEESATVTGTTTPQRTYPNSWEFTVIAVERGTDSGATSAQAVDIQSRIPTTLDNGLMRSSVQSMAPNTLTASALATDAVKEMQSGLALQSTLNTLGSTVVAVGLAVDGKPTLTQIEASTVLAKQNTLTTGVSDILSAVGNVEVDNQAIAEAVETQLADDFAAITETIDSETISQLVFQSIVGSGLAKYSIPQVTGTIEAVKYADFDLSISASTASDSVLHLSIGCENHTAPNLQADSTDGLTILNQLEDFDPADVTVHRTSPTVVDVWISARVLSKLSAADYLIALTEITTDNKTKLRFEKHFTIRSGVGRVIG